VTSCCKAPGLEWSETRDLLLPQQEVLTAQGSGPSGLLPRVPSRLLALGCRAAAQPRERSQQREGDPLHWPWGASRANLVGEPRSHEGES
jgi:hypothetical protein